MDVLRQDQQAHTSPLAASTSARIRISRSTCIFFMLFAHISTGLSQLEIFASPLTAVKVQYILLSSVLGHASVPLLTVVSGYLVASGRPKRYPVLVAAKVRSLLLPLMLWSLISIAMLVAAQSFTGKPLYQPATALDVVNSVTALTASPANYPLRFLRDLFVCMLLAPLFIRLSPRFGWPVLAILVVAALLERTWPLFLRAQLPLFFFIGVMLAHRSIAWVDRLRPVWFTGAIALTLLRVIAYQDVYEIPPLLDIVMRLFIAGSFWCFTRSVSERAYRVFKEVEPAVFLTFCSHTLTYGLLAIVATPFLGRYGDPLFPLYMVLQPIIALCLAYIAWRWFSWLPGFTLLNAGKEGGGGRLRTNRVEVSGAA